MDVCLSGFMPRFLVALLFTVLTYSGFSADLFVPKINVRDFKVTDIERIYSGYRFHWEAKLSNRKGGVQHCKAYVFPVDKLDLIAGRYGRYYEGIEMQIDRGSETFSGFQDFTTKAVEEGLITKLGIVFIALAGIDTDAREFSEPSFTTDFPDNYQPKGFGRPGEEKADPGQILSVKIMNISSAFVA